MRLTSVLPVILVRMEECATCSNLKGRRLLAATAVLLSQAKTAPTVSNDFPVAELEESIDFVYLGMTLTEAFISPSGYLQFSNRSILFDIGR